MRRRAVAVGRGWVVEGSILFVLWLRLSTRGGVGVTLSTKAGILHIDARVRDCVVTTSPCDKRMAASCSEVFLFRVVACQKIERTELGGEDLFDALEVVQATRSKIRLVEALEGARLIGEGLGRGKESVGLAELERWVGWIEIEVEERRRVGARCERTRLLLAVEEEVGGLGR